MIDESIGAGLNRNLGNPVAPGEAVEADLNRLIERRSRQKGPEEETRWWQESVKRYEEERRQVARLEWHAFHCGQAERHRATLQALIEHHKSEAARLMEDELKGAWGEERQSEKAPAYESP